MPNKRYDQFPAGTYDPAKILLQADPSTGELEKILLGDFPTGSDACLFSGSSLIAANNSGTNPQTTLVITVPAGTLANDGDCINWEAYLTTLTGSGAKTWNVRFNGTTILTRSINFAFYFRMNGSIVRNDATHMSYQSQMILNNTISDSAFANNVACDFTSNQNFDISITSGIANDIFINWANLRAFKA
jgi:hypothetical protein